MLLVLLPWHRNSVGLSSGLVRLLLKYSGFGSPLCFSSRSKGKYWVFTILLKVHLISPHPSEAAVYHYAAEVPLQYLDALHNPHLRVEKTVIITRYLVYLPTLPTTSESIVADGPFLELVSQILEGALDYEKFQPKRT